MAAGGNSNNIRLGAGRLYVAPIGTSEPVDGSSALPSAWRAIGYTEDGTSVTIDLTHEGIKVAEEVDPVLYPMTDRAVSLALSLAEMTRRNLALALGGGANAANGAQWFEPPDPGTDVAVMVVWDSDETPSATNTRWLFRQAKATGSIAMQRGKAPSKALIPVTFNIEKPTGLAPFRVYPNSSGLV